MCGENGRGTERGKEGRGGQEISERKKKSGPNGGNAHVSWNSVTNKKATGGRKTSCGRRPSANKTVKA